jgi:hypothetical protein
MAERRPKNEPVLTSVLAKLCGSMEMPRPES